MRKRAGVILMLLLAGCSKGGGAGRSATVTDVPDLSKLPPPMARPAFYEEAAVWRRHSQKGGGFTESAGDRFTPGEPVSIYVKAAEVPRGLAATVVIEGPAGRQFGTKREEIPAASRIVIFRFPDTAAWPVGEYRARIIFGGEEVDQKAFRLESGKRSK